MLSSELRRGSSKKMGWRVPDALHRVLEVRLQVDADANAAVREPASLGPSPCIFHMMIVPLSPYGPGLALVANACADEGNGVVIGRGYLVALIIMIGAERVVLHQRQHNQGGNARRPVPARSGARGDIMVVSTSCWDQRASSGPTACDLSIRRLTT